MTSGGTGSFELGTDGPSAILVGIDGSRNSYRAGAYAAGLARRQGARIIVVYVGPVSTMSAGQPSVDAVLLAAQSEVFDQKSADLREQIDTFAEARNLSVTFVSARGDSFAEISRIADQVRADAIVVGASTKAGHRLVGSLAVRLVRAGRWPVTVVP
ncbi:MAG TPA: universal stress protein [Streptosporangiaceae bacterium]|nr:universal stress protein [Streptosporangiaceae bacterium]